MEFRQATNQTKRSKPVKKQLTHTRPALPRNCNMGGTRAVKKQHGHTWPYQRVHLRKRTSKRTEEDASSYESVNQGVSLCSRIGVLVGHGIPRLLCQSPKAWNCPYHVQCPRTLRQRNAPSVTASHARRFARRYGLGEIPPTTPCPRHWWETPE